MNFQHFYYNKFQQLLFFMGIWIISIYLVKVEVMLSSKLGIVKVYTVDLYETHVLLHDFNNYFFNRQTFFFFWINGLNNYILSVLIFPDFSLMEI